MPSEFATEVQTIIGPVLEQFGFVLDQINDSPDEGGRRQHIVFYRSNDCKIQIYESSREGEVNCMIAPLDVSNEFGLRAKKWQYLTRFTKQPELPLEKLAQRARAEYEAYANPVEWV